MPKGTYKLRESQLHLYPWGIEPIIAPHGLKVDKIEFEYLLTKPPTKPKQNQDGSLSKAKIDTDALTYLEALREYGMEITRDHKLKIKQLMSETKFFFRSDSPRSPKVSKQILDEIVRTSHQIKQVHERPETGEIRTVMQACDWDCDYSDLCLGDLWGHDTSTLRKRNYQEVVNSRGETKTDE